MDTFRVVLALAARKGWKIHSMDVNCAYLNGDLYHNIYCKIPQGYRSNDKVICTKRQDLIGNPKTQCFKIDKPIYGLVQSGRQWNIKISNFIKNIGYIVATNDQSLFIKYNTQKKDKESNYILIYVDDILIFGDDNNEIERVKKCLNEEFEMTDLGECTKFIGLKIEHDRARRQIHLSAAHYTRKMIKDFGLDNKDNYPTVEVPFNPYRMLQPGDRPQDEIAKRRMRKYPFRQLYGKLNWLCTMFRKDIEVALGFIGAYIENPGMEAWIALVDCAVYVRDTCEMRMIYGREHSEELRMYAHSDSSFANPMDQYRSRSGGVIYLDNTVICCYSKKEKSTATAISTAEAELYAVINITNEIIFYIDLLENFNIITDGPIDVYVDNTAVLNMLDHPTGGKSKHVESRISRIRFLIDEEILNFEYIISPANTADQFTNIRTKDAFITARDKIGLQVLEPIEE
jgi:hypothetical protein